MGWWEAEESKIIHNVKGATQQQYKVKLSCQWGGGKMGTRDSKITSFQIAHQKLSIEQLETRESGMRVTGTAGSWDGLRGGMDFNEIVLCRCGGGLGEKKIYFSELK